MGKQLFKLIILALIAISTILTLKPSYISAPEIVEPKILGGVVPHHLVTKDVIEDFYKRISSEVAQPKIIVFLSPDHFGECTRAGVSFITSESQFPDFRVATDEINILKKQFNIKEDNASIYLDHGIANHLPFVKEYFGKSLILPILVSPKVTMDEAKNFASLLNSTLPVDTFVIASVDFSHYLPKQIEDAHDKKSIRVLTNFVENEFPAIDVDSWQSLFILRYISILRGYGDFEILAHKNAQDYSKEYLTSSTSYVSCIFKKGKLSTQDNEPTTLSFVGDIMLDRGVYQKILSNSYFYPFYYIEQTFRGIDLVVGNLEGPIAYKKVNFPKESLRFCFDKDVIQTLQYAHFTTLSLANNHTDNMGLNGISQTKEILQKGGIDFFGEPTNFKNSRIIEKNGVVLVGFNATYPFNLDEVSAWIRDIKEGYENSFVIIVMHFGEEYIGKSTYSDRYLAHTLIDAGADLIIGSHPHVVKDIELYESKKRNIKTLIFYSLGNFVFDQYFSKETQEGLVIFVTKYGKSFEFTIEPVSLTESQPKLMKENDRINFLNDLANKSSDVIKEQIKKGKITLTIDY